MHDKSIDAALLTARMLVQDNDNLHRGGHPARAGVGGTRRQLPEPPVGAVGSRQQRGVRAALDDPAVLEEDDLVGLDHGREAVRCPRCGFLIRVEQRLVIKRKSR